MKNNYLIFDVTCPKCGNKLNWVSYDYGTRWICSKCIEDKSDILHCEKGCKVKAVNFNCGYPTDKEKSSKYLKKDKVYTVEFISVGAYSSKIYLREFPGIEFNTVHFVRCK